MQYQNLKNLMIFTLFLICPFLSQANENNLESIDPLVEYLAEIVDHHRSENLKPAPIVAIGGCPGVGKTYLTQTLADALIERDIRCTILLLDDFIISAKERKKIGTLWDMRHLKIPELHAVLSSILSGNTLIEKPTRNPMTSETDSETMDLNGIDLILFDGLYSLCSIPPLNYFDYCMSGVFIEADASDIYQWRWERERIKASPRTPEQFNDIMEVYFNDYHQNIEYSKANASFILKKDGEHNYYLEYPHIERKKCD